MNDEDVRWLGIINITLMIINLFYLDVVLSYSLGAFLSICLFCAGLLHLCLSSTLGCSPRSKRSAGATFDFTFPDAWQSKIRRILEDAQFLATATTITSTHSAAPLLLLLAGALPAALQSIMLHGLLTRISVYCVWLCIGTSIPIIERSS